MNKRKNPGGTDEQPLRINPKVVVAYLHTLGMRGSEIGRQIYTELKNPDARVASDLIWARANRMIFDMFAEESVSREELRDLRNMATRDPWMKLEELLRRESGGTVKELRVFYSAPSMPANSEDWSLHLSRYAENGAWYIRDLLDRSVSGIGVSWGTSVNEVIRAMERRDRLYPDEYHKKRNLPVIPTVGDPVATTSPNGGISSTSLARSLSEILTGNSKHVPSLEGFCPVLPSDFTDEAKDAVRTFIKRMKPHITVFGFEGRKAANEGLVAKVDTILTSAGFFVSWKEFGHELMEVGGVELDELKRYAAGDIGGVLVPKEHVEGDPEAKARFEKITDLWTGISLAHYRNLAERAAGSQIPGVVLCAIGRNKARIVWDLIVRFKVVNVLAVDPHLAGGLEACSRGQVP